MQHHFGSSFETSSKGPCHEKTIIKFGGKKDTNCNLLRDYFPFIFLWHKVWVGSDRPSRRIFQLLLPGFKVKSNLLTPWAAVNAALKHREILMPILPRCIFCSRKKSWSSKGMATKMNLVVVSNIFDFSYLGK